MSKQKDIGLVTTKEVARAIKLDKFGFIGIFISWMLMSLIKISTLNKIYKRNKHLKELDFLNGILDDFQIKFEIPKDDFKRLPKEGSYITISNHPTNVDGILLLKLMLEQRPDFKLVANFLFERVEPIKPYIIPVNPFEDYKEAQSSTKGFIISIRHLRKGHPIGIFPAGEVSTDKNGKLIVDRPWEVSAIKLVKKAHVPIIPIFFDARNSTLFYKLSKLNVTLRLAKLPSEYLTHKRRIIKVRIGNPISVKDQQEHQSLDDFSAFIRNKTYILANAID